MKLLLLAALALAGFAHAADRKRNFIFVIADDHRWDAMGSVQKEHGDKARFPWFETPSMDRLAADGVRFRNAFITHSICSPGRAGFLSGQYTHVNGVMDNHTFFWKTPSSVDEDPHHLPPIQQIENFPQS